MSRFFFIEMGYPNSIIEGFHEVKSGAVPNAALVQPFSFPPLIRFLNRARYSRRLRRQLNFVPHRLWSHWHSLRRLPLSEDDENFVVLMPGTDIERLILPSLLRRFRSSRRNVRLILLLFDPINSPLAGNGWDRVREVFPLFDLVATFDKRDAEALGITHFYDPYGPRDVRTVTGLETDVFFVGHEKGRLDRLCAIADHLRGASIRFKFLVAGVSDHDKAIAHGLIPLATRLSYDEVLEHVVASRCLLEVLCEGQTSSSFRYYESVVYNKLLLTDNLRVDELPCFEPNYVQRFNEPREIDTDWIRRNVEVDYRYSGEFSVSNLMSLLERELSDQSRPPLGGEGGK